MTYQKALEAQKHNPAGVNKVLERLEWIEYLEKQKGGIVKKWSWSPQIGEWWLEISDLDTKGHLRLIHNVGNLEQVKSLLNGKLGKDWIIPILPWETIEEILEKAGYIFSIRDDINPETVSKNGFQCTIEKGFDSPVFLGYGRTRLPAVYEAILALGKELKC